MGLLGWALIAFIVAIVAAVLGFGRIAAGAASIGRVLFGLFIIVAIVLLILNFIA
jgi:uncharacterized membrane protein YtjA (UPF0391 family)